MSLQTSIDLLPAKEAAPRLNMTVSTLQRLGRNRVVPVCVLGYRTKRYSLEACRAALAKRTVKAL